MRIKNKLDKNNNPESSKNCMMLITNQIEEAPKGGRQLLCKLNYEVLKELFGSKLVVFELTKNPARTSGSVFNAFRGHIDGVTDNAIFNIIKEIKERNINKIFVDGSNLGEIISAVKESCPNCKALVFFHNVEARFFLGAFRQLWTISSFGVMIANYLAERKAVKRSDELICLNERDSSLLKRLYGRTATHICPLSLQDKFQGQLEESGFQLKTLSCKKYILFIGGAFYANLYGIRWFIKNVSQKINIKTYVIGNGMEKIKNEIGEGYCNVEVIGGVKDLSEWYRNALFVIAPIFDGSGMKTKVAEALMYGKMVVGTREAFTGYENIQDKVGYQCLTADEFVTTIESLSNKNIKMFDPLLRKIYLDNYSFQAARTRLADII